MMQAVMGWKREEQLRRQRVVVRVVVFCLLILVFIIYYGNVSGNTPEENQFAASGNDINRCPPSGIDWKVREVNDLRVKEIIEYVEWTNRSSCRLAHDFGGNVWPKVGLDGQKSICMDAEIKPDEEHCLVYSFGISNEWSFDEAMQTFGCTIHSFDPSMDLGDHQHSQNISFYNLGLGDRDERWHEPANGIRNWSIRSLDSIYRQLGHEDRFIDYLKIDIEHSEWIALPQILKSGMLDRVRQLAVEIHLPEQGTLEEFRERVAVLKSIEDYGMARFDSKYNPWSLEWNVAVDYEGYMAYELAWHNTNLRRKKPNSSLPKLKPLPKLKSNEDDVNKVFKKYRRKKITKNI